MGRSIEDQELYNQLRQANVEIDSIAGEQIRVLVGEHQALKQEQEDLQRVIGVGEDAFEKLWKGAINGATDWRDVMGSILDDVTNMFYDLAVKAPLQDLMGSVFGQGGGKSSGGGIGSMISSFAGSLFGGGGGGMTGGFNIGSLFGFADGGSFKVGGNGGTDSQLVAFRASPDETVTVARPEQQGGGNGGMYVTIDARGAANGVEEKIMAAIGMLDKSIERRALNATENQMKRNPKFGR
jgi:phage-related minor tail protein